MTQEESEKVLYAIQELRRRLDDLNVEVEAIYHRINYILILIVVICFWVFTLVVVE